MAKFKSHADRRTAIIPIVRTMRTGGEIAHGNIPADRRSAGDGRRLDHECKFRHARGRALSPGRRASRAAAQLDSIYLEAMQAWEESKTGKTVETTAAVNENNFVRARRAAVA